jgi:hypothetical protein
MARLSPDREKQSEGNPADRRRVATGRQKKSGLDVTIRPAFRGFTKMELTHATMNQRGSIAEDL